MRRRFPGSTVSCEPRCVGTAEGELNRIQIARSQDRIIRACERENGAVVPATEEQIQKELRRFGASMSERTHLFEELDGLVHPIADGQIRREKVHIHGARLQAKKSRVCQERVAS